eukprot:jgi/Botrbrau1/18332/Bobra.0179s0059.1
MELAGRVMDPSVLLVLMMRDMKDLPFEVLIKILAKLDLSSLRKSRLVCKAFRTASIPCITKLQGNCLTNEMTPVTLAHSLSAFSSITELRLRVALPRDASVFVLPAALSTLRSLALEFFGTWEAVSHSWELSVPRLAGATQLTALSINSRRIEGAGFKLADSLRAFTTLEELTLHAIPAGEAETLAEAVSELPRLCKLRSFPGDDCFWGSLVRNATRMTRLQSLAWLDASPDSGWEQLASLTQLTYLRFGLAVRSDAPSHVTQLSRLSSLQVLNLRRIELRKNQLCQLVSSMTQLRELDVTSSDAADGLDPLLACLPLVTNLKLRRSSLEPVLLPTRLVPNGFASLRAISLDLWWNKSADVVQFAEALTALESLKLVCAGAVAQTFLSRLHCIRNLTELDLRHDGPRASSTPACVCHGLWTELPHLQSLALHDMEGFLLCNDGVQYLAALTRLTKLRIKQVLPARPLTSAQVQPLTVLTQLKQLFCSRSWGAAFDSPAFKGALHGRQHELGLRRTCFELQEGLAWQAA